MAYSNFREALKSARKEANKTMDCNKKLPVRPAHEGDVCGKKDRWIDKAKKLHEKKHN